MASHYPLIREKVVLDTAADNFKQRKKIITIGIQACISIGSLIALFWLLNERSFLDQVTQIDVGTIILATSLTFLQVLFAGMRWNYILRSYRLNFRFLSILRIQLASLFASLFLPASIGGGVGKILLLVKAAPALKVLESVILDKLFALMSLALLCVISFAYILLNYPQLMELFREQGMIAGIFLVLFLALILKRRGHRFISTFTRIFNEIPRISLGNLYRITASSMATTILTAITFAAIAAPQVPDLNIVEFLIMLPPIMMAAALPISFNGWGVREAASIAVLSLIGINSDQALVISIQFGLLTMIPSLTGAFFWYLLPEDAAREEKQP